MTRRTGRLSLSFSSASVALVALAAPLAFAAACHGASPAPPVPAVATASVAPSAPASVAVADAAPPAPALPPFPAAWPYPESPPPVTGAHGMVVSDNAIATKVGVDILSSGGNAADAAIAVAFALAVAYPEAGNLGGGGFMVARVGGATSALDFRETAPAAAKHDLFLGADGKPTGASREGYLSSGVPGSVAGMAEAYAKLASKKKTWAELLAPAIALARDGFTVDDELAHTVADDAKGMARYPSTMKIYFPGGHPLAAGSTWKNPDLAAALQRIADNGADGFYKGTTADLLVKQMQSGHGLITHADLAAYRAKWRTPIELDYRGHHLTTMPPPSSSGVTLGMICHILEGYDLAKDGWDSPEHLHLEFEATRRAFAARNAKLGDPDFVSNPVDALLSADWATAARATIQADKKSPVADILGATTPSSGNGPHTTHYSVVDSDGNAVAITTTLNWWYGSDVVVDGAGFLMNNEMDDFAAVPGKANGFGLVQGEPNAVAPGKRMLSSMSPTIVTGKDGHVELVLGAAGGPRIITAVFQELSNVIDFGFDVTSAVNAPRFHAQDQPDTVFNEPSGLPAPLATALTAMGYTFQEKGHLADSPAIGWSGGQWIGAAEPRRTGGLALGY